MAKTLPQLLTKAREELVFLRAQRGEVLSDDEKQFLSEDSDAVSMEKLEVLEGLLNLEKKHAANAAEAEAERTKTKANTAAVINRVTAPAPNTAEVTTTNFLEKFNAIECPMARGAFWNEHKAIIGY